MPIKSLKLLVIACSSLVLFNNTNYCYSMEEDEINDNGWEREEEQDILNNPQTIRNPGLFKNSEIAEINYDKLIKSKEYLISVQYSRDLIQKHFSKYKDCLWYKELIESITDLEQNVICTQKMEYTYQYYAPSHTYVTKVYKNLQNILGLPQVLLKYNIILNSEQTHSLKHVTNDFRTIYYALINYCKLPMQCVILVNTLSNISIHSKEKQNSNVIIEHYFDDVSSIFFKKHLSDYICTEEHLISLQHSKSLIQKYFSEFKDCIWYKDILNLIQEIAFTKKDENWSNSPYKFINKVKQYWQDVLGLNKVLFKCNVILTSEQIYALEHVIDSLKVICLELSKKINMFNYQREHNTTRVKMNGEEVI